MEEYIAQFPVVQSYSLLCRKWAEVIEGAKALGYTIKVADAWIAATALAYNIPLITHNAKDYRGVAGLQIISTPD